MKGYVCDRCKGTHACRDDDQRGPGPWPPDGWVEIRLPRKSVVAHLCDTCVLALEDWIDS